MKINMVTEFSPGDLVHILAKRGGNGEYFAPTEIFSIDAVTIEYRKTTHTVYYGIQLLTKVEGVFAGQYLSLKVGEVFQLHADAATEAGRRNS